MHGCVPCGRERLPHCLCVDAAAVEGASGNSRGPAVHAGPFARSSTRSFTLLPSFCREKSRTIPGNNHQLAQLVVYGFATAIEASVSKTLWNAMEKQLAYVASKSKHAGGGSPQLRLAACNAALSRIDLVVGALAPLVVSSVASSLGVRNALFALVGLQLLGAAAASPWMIDMCAAAGPSVVEVEDDAAGFADVRLVIYAHALLHFTVVSPGGLLLVWLRERKVAETTITAFVAAAQICGACGSYIPDLVLRQSEGLEAAAAKVQAMQAVAVVAAMGAVCGGSQSVLLLSTVLSRAALWGIDLLGRQIVQERAGARRMQAFALQGSLSQVAACSMYCLAFAGASFPVQCCASASSVVLAVALLAIHMRRVGHGTKGA